MRDARTEVDARLRAVIGELVTVWGQRISNPLYDNSFPTKGGKFGDLAVTSSGDVDADRARAVREAVEREVPLIRRKMDEYIHDVRTRDMLMRAVLEDVIQRYESWLEERGLESPTTPSTKHKGKGKGREDGVWESEVFADWALRAFGLDGMEMSALDDD
jgi:conserved oligomeric Golgi complex subunit 3